MKFYLAPMEGLTGYIYRNAYQKCFHQVDKYFAPFISASKNKKLANKDKKDLLPENNENMQLIPQLLANNAEAFLHTAGEIEQLGYSEINLNLGCPSGTVVAKKKGAGFLEYPKELDQFLNTVFEKTNMKISIKTRIGRYEPEEFDGLLRIYNQYPLTELIIHPRTQLDFYKNHPNLQVFGETLTKSTNPVCYNGDIHSYSDFRAFGALFPQVDTVMLGRGILMHPGLAGEIKERWVPQKDKLREFHDCLYEGYQQVMYGERNVLFKMKELWVYLAASFTDTDSYMKKICKAERLCDYELAVNALFREQNIVDSSLLDRKIKIY